MPANYVLLEKITVGAAGASTVEFSNIPQTGYTDLVVKASCRGDSTATAFTSLRLLPNGSSSSGSTRWIRGNGSAASSDVDTTAIYSGESDTDGATANTFTNVEWYIPNYAGSTNKSFSIDSAHENNATTAYLHLVAGLWSSSSAITSITLDLASGSFKQYSTFYLYGVAKLGTTPAISPYATGGDTIMTDGTYWWHIFNSSGTFTPAKSLSCDYLVVAGGGGGGGNAQAFNAGGGGGGAGGYLTSTTTLASSTPYTVTIGAGGSGVASQTASNGSNGSNSVFGSITATGGGGGARGTVAGANGLSGGSGGGSSYLGTGGAASPSGQGNAGGDSTGSSVYGGAGGGGAGSAGTAKNSNSGGAGGNGLSSLITGSSVTRGGGGGGGAYGAGTAGTGGTGGGGAGGTDTAGAGTAGTVNTGAGGGGAGGNTVTNPSGAGGSGIVVVRYLV